MSPQFADEDGVAALEDHRRVGVAGFGLLRAQLGNRHSVTNSDVDPRHPEVPAAHGSS